MLVAGLEPARYLYRGILRYLRVDFQENFTKEEKCKNGAILHEKPSKRPQNKQFLQKIIHAPISLKNSQVPRSSQNYAVIKNEKYENFEALFSVKGALLKHFIDFSKTFQYGRKKKSSKMVYK